MDIKTAQYFKSPETGKNSSIGLTFKNSDDIRSVPMNEHNSDYIEILEQVKEGTLTIQDAD
tara:strand:+ start:1384 stop:1566 length:183 start_codon:yes stop_codon:yes gene_type:complete